MEDPVQELIVGNVSGAKWVEACYEAEVTKQSETRMWANAQPDGRPAEHRWRPLFNARKFG